MREKNGENKLSSEVFSVFSCHLDFVVSMDKQDFPKLDSLSQVLVPGLAKTGQREAFSKRLPLFILTHLMKGACMGMFLRICFYFVLQHYFYTQLKIPPFNLPRLGMVPDVVQQKPTHCLLSDQQSFL